MADVLQIKIEGAADIARWMEQHALTAADVVEEATVAAANIIRNDARQRAPSSDGIDSEVVKRSSRAVEVDVAPNTQHAHYNILERGAAPHEITPDQAGAITFPGAAHPINSVKHTGFAARPMMRPAADTKETAATVAANQKFKQAMDNV